MRQVFQDQRPAREQGRLAEDLGGPGAGHGQVGEHLVQPGRGPQLLQLVVDDQGVHGLGDLDERDLAGEDDQGQPAVLGGRDERRGQPARVLAAEFDGEGAHAHPGQAGHVGADERLLVRQRDPGGEHQLAAAQQPGRVGELDRVYPADRPVQPAGCRHHLRLPALHRIEPENLPHRRHPSPPPRLYLPAYGAVLVTVSGSGGYS